MIVQSIVGNGNRVIFEILAVVVTIIAILWGLANRSTRLNAAKISADQIDQLTKTKGELLSSFQALSQQSAETTTALDRMRDGVLMVDRKQRLLLLNPAAVEFFGLNPETNYAGRLVSDVVRVPELIKAITMSTQQQALQLELVAGAKLYPIVAEVIPFQTLSGTKILVTLHDETEARRVDEMRREFTANLSHELNTPLAAIKGYAETVGIAMEDDLDAAKHFMKQINRECQRLEQLVSGMMQLARAQSGSENLRVRPLLLREVLEQSLHSNLPIARAKGIQLLVDSLSQECVMADAEAALTIVNNLLGNALKYTPDGGTVRVGFQPSGEFFSIYVEDTGIGISEQDQERIFDRFFRVETKRQIPSGDEISGLQRGDGEQKLPVSAAGTGIGLSIVKNLTHSMGGEVRLTSHPNQGSRFEVLLPKAKQSAVS